VSPVVKPGRDIRAARHGGADLRSRDYPSEITLGDSLEAGLATGNWIFQKGGRRPARLKYGGVVARIPC